MMLNENILLSSVYPIWWRLENHYYNETDDEVDWFEKEKTEHEEEMRRMNSRTEKSWMIEMGLISLNKAQKQLSAEQIKELVDIKEIVENYTRLSKAGTRYIGRCPFHNEKTPSFFVFPQSKTWHCFGCSKGGDVITLIMEAHQLDFKESLKFLEALL